MNYFTQRNSSHSSDTSQESLSTNGSAPSSSSHESQDTEPNIPKVIKPQFTPDLFTAPKQLEAKITDSSLLQKTKGFASIRGKMNTGYRAGFDEINRQFTKKIEHFGTVGGSLIEKNGNGVRIKSIYSCRLSQSIRLERFLFPSALTDLIKKEVSYLSEQGMYPEKIIQKIIQSEAFKTLTLPNKESVLKNYTKQLFPTISFSPHLATLIGGENTNIYSYAATLEQLRKMQGAAPHCNHIETLIITGENANPDLVEQADAIYSASFPNADEVIPKLTIHKQLATREAARALKHDTDSSAPPDFSFMNIVFCNKTDDGKKEVRGEVKGAIAGGGFLHEYIDNAKKFQNKGMLSIEMATTHAMLANYEKTTGKEPHGSFWEAEPHDFGGSKEERAYARTRLEKIYKSAGMRAIMGVDKDGNYVNLHMQPKLTAESNKIALHYLYKPYKFKEGDQNVRGDLSIKAYKEMQEGYMQYMADKDRGLEEAWLEEVKEEIKGRLVRCVRIELVPLDKLPSIVELAKTDETLKRQVLETYNVETLEQAAELLKKDKTTVMSDKFLTNLMGPSLSLSELIFP